MLPEGECGSNHQHQCNVLFDGDDAQKGIPKEEKIAQDLRQTDILNFREDLWAKIEGNMSDHTYKHELSRDIERYLAAISKLYETSGKRQLQEIIVNAQIRVVEEWSSDNWDGGIYGHAIYLRVPQSVFLKSVDKKIDIANQIKEDLNRVHNVRGEFIDEVFLEMEPTENHDWRKNSGLLVGRPQAIPPDATVRIWGPDGFRVFLSHRSEVKKEASKLKDDLSLFGISSFVAHVDIHPTKEWQNEIEYALDSMDGFVALMTADFHDSDWTDQEVGFAVARGVPMIAAGLGKAPYGFIGKFQALSCGWETAPNKIAALLIKHDKMFNSYISALRKCTSWENGNVQAELFPALNHLTTSQIDNLVACYNETEKLHGSFAFNGSKPRNYGPGLAHHLNRLGTRQFKLSKTDVIEIAK